MDERMDEEMESYSKTTHPFYVITSQSATFQDCIRVLKKG